MYGLGYGWEAYWNNIYYDSEAAIAAAIQPFALSHGGWCTINYSGGGVWSGQTPSYTDGILTFEVNQENYSYTAFPGDANPCQGHGTYQPLVAEDTNLECPQQNPGDWTLVYDSATNTGPYCACPWGTSQACPTKPCYKGAVNKGDPCNALSGVEMETETDYRAASSPLKIERIYNSAFAYQHYFQNGNDTPPLWTPLGIGWSSVYFQRVSYTPVPNYSGLIATRADGSDRPFTESSPNVFDFLGETEDRVQRSFDSHGTQTGWQYITGADDVEQYDLSGRLQSITTRAGVVQTLQYDGSGNLSTVTDSFGRQLTFLWSSDRHVQSITLPDGNSVGYTYDASGNLSTVTYPDTTSRTYLYELTYQNQNLLTGLKDETSTRYATWSYDWSNHVTGSQLAGGVASYSFAYPSDTTRTVIDPLGTSRTYTVSKVDAHLRYTGTSSTCGGCAEASAQTYDVRGNVASRTDFDGNVSHYFYDTVRSLETSRTEAYGTPRARTIATVWNPNFRLPASITESNRTKSFTYDGSGNALTKAVTDTSVTPNVTRTWTYTYDNYGRMLTAKGPRTDLDTTTHYAYYTCTTGIQCGQVHTVTDALGHITTYNTYNAHGQPLTITDPNNVVTTLTYDLRQRLTSRSVSGETTSFSYWPTGLLKQVTLPDSSYVLYTYDGAHRLTQINDGLGNKVVYTLDAMGNRTAENNYDPSSNLHRTHTRVMNTLNELYQDVNAAGTAAVTTTFGYDNNGNQTTINAPLARNTTNAYDELNRLAQVTDPNNGITKFGYDANDNLTSVIDPRNLTTSYTPNGFGDVTSQVSPDTGTTNNTYDSGGNLATSTDARSAVATYTYDALNRVTSVAYKIGGTTDQTITFTYDTGADGIGRLAGASDASHSMSWTYDSLGRVTGKGQVVGGVTRSVGYGYTNGNPTSLVTPSGQTVTYGYNTNHQITSVTVNGTTLLSSVTYEPLGPANGWTWGNGTSEVRAFNTDGNLGQVNAIEAHAYGYDNALRITSIANNSNSALSFTYSYDTLDRIASASGNGLTEGWTYDANGNRLTQTGTVGGSYTPSATSNRLNSITGSPARTYSYDADGNTLTYSNITYTYYNNGRMKTAKVGSSTTTYVYNALGQRAKKSGGSAGTVLMSYDEAGHILGEYSSTGALVQETVWMGNIPVATIRPNGSSVTVYYVHADHLNAPRMVTRSTDNKIAWRWDTDPFGTSVPNQNPQGLGTFVYNLRYPGQYYDSETGLFQNGFRDYDPAVGRYLESDPIGLWGGLNSYAYARENPLLRIDPSGLADFIEQCVGRYATCSVTQSPDAWTVGNWLRFQICKRAINNACSRTGPTCCEEDDRHCRASAVGDAMATLKCAMANAKCLRDN